jgi:hypothetical protein
MLPKAATRRNPQKAGIDTTDVNRGGTGHSDYLGVPAACRDFAATVQGNRDNVPGRQATHLPHVFRLLANAPKVKGDVAAICKKLL